MDKRLVLLGLLRGQKLHGYGLVEYLATHATGGAAIGRSNAYRLLGIMEGDGLVSGQAERDGNRPQRHVYKITKKGDRLFRKLLLDCLAEDATVDQPGIAVLNYLDAVEPAQAADQLQHRRDRVARRRDELAEMPADVIDLHPALDLTRRQLDVELAWLDEKLVELRRRAVA